MCKTHSDKYTVAWECILEKSKHPFHRVSLCLGSTCVGVCCLNTPLSEANTPPASFWSCFNFNPRQVTHSLSMFSLFLLEAQTHVAIHHSHSPLCISRDIWCSLLFFLHSSQGSTSPWTQTHTARDPGANSVPSYSASCITTQRRIKVIRMIKWYPYASGAALNLTCHSENCTLNSPLCVFARLVSGHGRLTCKFA